MWSRTTVSLRCVVERRTLVLDSLLYSAMVDRVRVSGHEAPPPDVVTHNSLIKVCCRATDPCAGFFFQKAGLCPTT
jgi:hypothetical protein